MKPTIDDKIESSAADHPSVFTSIFHSGINQNLAELQQIEINPKFNQETWFARNGYFVSSVLPFNNQVSGALQSLNASHVSGVLKRVNSINELLNNLYQPVYYIDQLGVSTFRNLDLVEFSFTTDSTGGINLNSQFNNFPRILDAPLIISNPYGEVSFISPERIVVGNNNVTLDYSGYYRARYSCITFMNQLSSGSYLSIDGFNYQAQSKDLPNVLDDYGKILGIRRLVGEDNISFRLRCQTLSLSRKAEGQISAALGKSIPFFWYSGVSLSINASGWTNPELPAIPKYSQIQETIYRDGNVFLTSYDPIGPLKLVYNLDIIPSTMYSVTGNTIIPNTDFLTAYPIQSLQAQYMSQTYTTSGTTVFQLNSSNLNPALFYGALPTSVKVDSSEKDLDTWVWGIDSSNSGGAAVFD